LLQQKAVAIGGNLFHDLGRRRVAWRLAAYWLKHRRHADIRSCLPFGLIAVQPAVAL
jgi:hypothetical protein